ncbi:hypothetical protein Tco_1567126 [Tanacetum coccineum]
MLHHQTLIVPQVIPQVSYQSPQAPIQLMTKLPFVDSGFTVPVFSPGDDPIACLNKAMAFLTVVASSLLPIINSEVSLIQETKPLFKMTGLQCNKFKGDKGKIILDQLPASHNNLHAYLSPSQQL